ncbi:MAG: TIM barrel protein [Clostridiaceae bacterium]|nr:TIM barrel protein [Clostridiaceae bacterium]
MIWFGPAGNSDSFYEEGYKHSWQMPQWLSSMGLNAYEYQCNKGIHLKDETAREIGEKCREHNIRLSIHAPYYINLASTEAEKRERSIKYILDTLRIGKVMGAERIVVHPGYVSGITRQVAIELALDTLMETIKRADEQDLSGVTICPEVLGKTNQLGTLEEVIVLCSLDERLIPCIDFAHMHALTQGGMVTSDDFKGVFKLIEKHLGTERIKKAHIHFSRVEYGKGGEKKHWSYSDTQYGPDFNPLAQAIIELGLEPVIICESRDTMAEDARILKKIYEEERAKLIKD